MKNLFLRPLALTSALLTVTSLFAVARSAAEVVQKTYPNPDDAITALVAAAKAGDKPALREIFGPKLKDLSSNDPVQGDAEIADFAKSCGEAMRVDRTDEKVTLTIGADGWPFPIPLIKTASGWRFDTAAGVDELLCRRVGEDELNAIEVCRAYVDAQREYAQTDWDGDEILEYAERILSSEGKKDGLYWPVTDGETISPLGELVAAAQDKGYKKLKNASGEPQPYEGYFFRVLKRQGPAAPGGRYNYMINGHMIGGFALVAFPHDWGRSGIMTFIVNQQGKVYEKNLGPKTAELARAMTEYNPDKTWTPAKISGAVEEAAPAEKK
jgi:hypothetical protein